MKRLVKANENTDNVFSLFKDAVSIDEIVSELKDAYQAWEDASQENQQIDDLQFSNLADWFENFYSSIIGDLITKAKENYDFEEKYNNLSNDEQNEVDNSVKDYVYNLKNDLINNLQRENNENE